MWSFTTAGVGAGTVGHGSLNLKVIVMTGHSEAVLKAGRMGSTNVDGLLIKPFGLNAMREKIEEVLRPHRSDGANQPNPQFCGKDF